MELTSSKHVRYDRRMAFSGQDGPLYAPREVIKWDWKFSGEEQLHEIQGRQRSIFRDHHVYEWQLERVWCCIGQGHTPRIFKTMLQVISALSGNLTLFLNRSTLEALQALKVTLSSTPMLLRGVRSPGYLIDGLLAPAPGLLQLHWSVAGCCRYVYSIWMGLTASILFEGGVWILRVYSSISFQKVVKTQFIKMVSYLANG